MHIQSDAESREFHDLARQLGLHSEEKSSHESKSKKSSSNLFLKKEKGSNEVTKSEFKAANQEREQRVKNRSSNDHPNQIEERPKNQKSEISSHKADESVSIRSSSSVTSQNSKTSNDKNAEGF